MKITNIEILQSKTQRKFAEPYYPGWQRPNGGPSHTYGAALVKINTDEGISGYGPCRGNLDQYRFVIDRLMETDPLHIERFWRDCMIGREIMFERAPYGGIDIALWDIAGKAAGLPVCKMLGAAETRVPVYAATSRLLSAEEHIEQVQELQSLGFKAVKLRLHRQDYRDDLAVVQAVRSACPDVSLLVDANQNHHSAGYNYWDRPTVETVARELSALGVVVLEDPCVPTDLECLKRISRDNKILVAGGECTPNIYWLREHMLQGAYDVIVPDLIINDIGITGFRKLGVVSEYLGKQIMPHICALGPFALNFAAALQVASGLSNCPWVEFPYDPPFLTEETQQFYIREKFRVESDGRVAVPQSPGLGVEVMEDAL